MKLNNKGFALTEVLILSSVVIGVLTFMYIQFKNINRSYQKSFNYDTVEGMYLANNILNYINDDNYDLLVEQLENNPKGYIDITNCSIELFETPTFCENLFEKSKIEKILFTKENLYELKQNLADLDNGTKDYINQLKITNAEKEYRIIIKYNNNTFASMRFNKGIQYVQRGLIAYLDGINNTGNGHSGDTTTWKDLSENDNDVTLYNSPSWSNNSITFDGQTNYGKIDATSNMTYENGITLETRVKILSYVGTDLSNSIEFLNNWENAGLGLKFTGNQKFASSIFLQTYNPIEALQASELNQYYTIVLTYDNQTQKLYINGDLVVSNTYSSSDTIKPAPVPITIGANSTPTSMDSYSNVEFQNILIYDRALSSTEIQRNYQADLARY